MFFAFSVLWSTFGPLVFYLFGPLDLVTTNSYQNSLKFSDKNLPSEPTKFLENVLNKFHVWFNFSDSDVKDFFLGHFNQPSSLIYRLVLLDCVEEFECKENCELLTEQVIEETSYNPSGL